MPKTETATKVKDSVDAVLEQTPFCADGCGGRVNSPRSTFLQGHDQRLISRLAVEVVEDVELSSFARKLLELDTVERYDDAGDIQDRIDRVAAAVIMRFSSGLGFKFESAAHRRWELWTAKGERAAQKALKVAAPKRTRVTKKNATSAVSTELQKNAPNSFEPVGGSFSLDSLEDYRKQATAWLGDKSELSSEQLEKADWREIYDWFTSQSVTPEQRAAIKAMTPEQAREAASTVGKEVVNLRGTLVNVKIGRWKYEARVVGMNQKGEVSAVEYTDKKGVDKTTDKFEILA